MLPPKSNKLWVDLVTGKIDYNFKSVPASLLISRLKRETARNNSSEFIEKCIEEAYNFFQKYESLVKEDLNNIFGS